MFVDKKSITEIDINKTVEVIKKRLERFVRNVDVNPSSNGEIVIKVSSYVQIDKLNTIIENKGKLDFWECVDGRDLMSFLFEVDNKLKTDSVSNPLTSIIKNIDYQSFPLFSTEDTVKVKSILKDQKIKELYTDENYYLEFLFGLPKENLVTLHGITSNRERRSKVNDKHIISAQQDYDQIGKPAISITMDNYGASQWFKMTKYAFENRTQIAISVNDVVYSAPGVSVGAISGGKSQVSGNFTLEEAQNLSAILNGGGRIPKLKFLHSKKIKN